jgi:hypothetical protein
MLVIAICPRQNGHQEIIIASDVATPSMAKARNPILDGVQSAIMTKVLPQELCLINASFPY